MPPTPYDEFPYESLPYEETHPDRIAAIAVLHGLEPPRPSTARVLELGCGSGANAVATAYAYPHARVVGIDLAETAIAEASALAAEVGAPNATFAAADLAELADGRLGEFDYVVAHGVYAWVPPATREALLEAARAHLSEHGVAYVSFNSQPGGHFRRALRDLALWWVRDVADEGERAERARALFDELYDLRASDDPYGSLLGRELDALRKSATYLIHDLLSDHWRPVWFHEFAAAAARHGLRYVAESRFERLRDGHWPDGVEARLDALAGGDRIARTQLGDVLGFERFRATLVCHARHDVADRPDLTRIERLRLRIQAPPREEDPEPVRAALAALLERAPRPVPFAELHAATGGDAGALARALYDAAYRGQVAMHLDPPEIGDPRAERPLVSAFARRQAARGGVTGTLYNRSIGLSGETERRLLTLLDGTRDRDEVLAALGADGRPALTRDALDATLVDLAGVGLLAPARVG